MAKHILHSPLQRLWLDQSLVDGLLQVLIVGAVGEVHIIATIDGGRSLMHHIHLIRQLVNGRIVAHHHAVESHIASQDILEDLAVGHALDAMHRMVARHHHIAPRQPYHCLVGQQYLLHHLLLIGITATAIAEIVLGAGPYPLLQVSLLEASHKGSSHHRREVAILSVRLLQAVEAGCAANIHHRRECQHTAHFPHHSACLLRLQLCQLRVERTGLTYLLWIDGSTQRVHPREHLFVEQCRYAVGGVVHQPVLNGCSPVPQYVRVSWLLHSKLGEVADAERYQLTALGSVQPSLLIEKLVHIHTSQLRDALFLRHLGIELIHLLLHIHRLRTARREHCQPCQCQSAYAASRFFLFVTHNSILLFLYVHIYIDNKHLRCKDTNKSAKYRYVWREKSRILHISLFLGIAYIGKSPYLCTHQTDTRKKGFIVQETLQFIKYLFSLVERAYREVSPLCIPSSSEPLYSTQNAKTRVLYNH